MTDFQPGDRVKIREGSAAAADLPGLLGRTGLVIALLSVTNPHWSVWAEFEDLEEFGFKPEELEKVDE